MYVSHVGRNLRPTQQENGMTEYVYNIIDCNTFIVLSEYAFVMSNDIGKQMSKEAKIKALQAKAESRYKENHKAGNITAILRSLREL